MVILFLEAIHDHNFPAAHLVGNVPPSGVSNGSGLVGVLMLSARMQAAEWESIAERRESSQFALGHTVG